MFVWIIVAVLGRQGPRSAVPSAPVESGLQGILRSTAESYKAKTGPISAVADRLAYATVAPKALDYAQSYKPIKHFAAAVEAEIPAFKPMYRNTVTSPTHHYVEATKG